ncbi:helix-turn-helix domain-containing protein [Bradyrhizobium sp. USDA 4452]
MASLRRHHGEGEPPAVVPVPEPAKALPPIPNAVIAGACKIAFPPEPQPIILGQVEAVQRAVLQEFPTITMADLKSARRTALVVRARQLAMYLAKRVTSKSLPEIGRRFGGRDHTTVLHAVRKIEAKSQKDAGLAEQIARIKENIPEIRL